MDNRVTTRRNQPGACCPDKGANNDASFPLSFGSAGEALCINRVPAGKGIAERLAAVEPAQQVGADEQQADDQRQAEQHLQHRAAGNGGRLGNRAGLRRGPSRQDRRQDDGSPRPAGGTRENTMAERRTSH